MRIEKDQLLTLSAIAAMFGLFTFFVWMPSRASTEGYKDRIAEVQAVLGPNMKDPHLLADRSREVQELRDKVNSDERQVPDQPRLAEFLRSLTEVAQERLVSRPELETLETKRFERYNVIPAQLQCRGSFVATYQVLRDIEKLPRLVRVDELHLRIDRSRDSNNVVSSTFQLSTFYASEDEAEK